MNQPPRVSTAVKMTAQPYLMLPTVLYSCQLTCLDLFVTMDCFAPSTPLSVQASPILHVNMPTCHQMDILQCEGKRLSLRLCVCCSGTQWRRSGIALVMDHALTRKASSCQVLPQLTCVPLKLSQTDDLKLQYQSQWGQTYSGLLQLSEPNADCCSCCVQRMKRRVLFNSMSLSIIALFLIELFIEVLFTCHSKELMWFEASSPSSPSSHCSDQ